MGVLLGVAFFPNFRENIWRIHMASLDQRKYNSRVRMGHDSKARSNTKNTYLNYYCRCGLTTALGHKNCVLGILSKNFFWICCIFSLPNLTLPNLILPIVYFYQGLGAAQYKQCLRNACNTFFSENKYHKVITQQAEAACLNHT